MPLWLEYTGFVIGIIGFILTILTFLNTCKFKKQLIHNSEISDFRKNIDNILQRLESFVSSITDDQLHDKTFNSSLVLFLADLQSRYTFLSTSSKKIMVSLQKRLMRTDISTDEWIAIAKSLVNLNNSLKKERAIYG